MLTGCTVLHHVHCFRRADHGLGDGQYPLWPSAELCNVSLHNHPPACATGELFCKNTIETHAFNLLDNGKVMTEVETLGYVLKNILPPAFLFQWFAFEAFAVGRLPSNQQP